MTRRLRVLLAGGLVLALSVATAVQQLASPTVASAASPGTVVHRFQTSESGDRLATKADLAFAADTSDAVPTIEVDPRVQLQAIDGFGATFNEAGYSLLAKLPAAQQQSLMSSIFNPTTGSGFSLTRLPMGTNDFAFLPDYTLDDVASGSTDFSLASFSLARDQQRLIPFVKARRRVASSGSSPHHGPHRRG